ncbi:MAG TPA: pyridoxine 5'-phosphate synthase [Elusimicrobia bacterium]|nr:pyridoxine 5'-phosphate synthase [Elusimicrobiota bacterium]
MPVKLGVNIDHIATLRQARGGVDPDPIGAARVCRAAGADVIVAHLRQDRRHIQEADLQELRKLFKRGLHLELSVAPEMLSRGARVRPDSVCLVPESPSEVTTQGGLDLKRNEKAVGKAVEKLKKAGIGVSLFVDPDALSVRAAKSLGADAVELCTLRYAKTTGKHLQQDELEKISLAAYLAEELELELHAGHDLDYSNVAPIAQISNMRCLNIGFAIIARSVFTGLKAAVVEMKRLIVASR